jgi:hypothetical protein
LLVALAGVFYCCRGDREVEINGIIIMIGRRGSRGRVVGTCLVLIVSIVVVVMVVTVLVVMVMTTANQEAGNVKMGSARSGFSVVGMSHSGELSQEDCGYQKQSNDTTNHAPLCGREAIKSIADAIAAINFTFTAMQTMINVAAWQSSQPEVEQWQ